MTAILTSCQKCGRAVVASSHRCPVRPNTRPVLVEPAPVEVIVTVIESEPIASNDTGPRSKGRPVHLSPTHAAIMEAARTLPAPFSREALAVACWQIHPARFALRGFAEHPNSTAVWCKLAGAGGLIDRGLIEQDATGLRVTRAGMAMGSATELSARMRGMR
jgi:hypothetical protein